MKRIKQHFYILLLLVAAAFTTACGNTTDKSDTTAASGVSTDSDTPASDISAASVEDVPAYSGEPYIEINNNEPEFTEEELDTSSYESYSELDTLGRCGTATACVGTDLMPTEERGSIGQVKPSGWHTVKYNGLVDGNYLYNRCHLIGYQLTGENANEENLITGTRYLNVEGMLPFENEIADYVSETDNHVLYRVTPIYEGENLVASGVQMEAKSLEDDGKGVTFNVYCYNAQPGIEIDYATGESHKADTAAESKETNKSETTKETAKDIYIINKNTHKFHKPDCSSVKDMKPKNKKEFTGSRDELINQDLDPCDRCRP